MVDQPEVKRKPLPPPWDRIFSLGTRIFVWALLAGVIYILRPFFLLVFLTFVFGYIQAHGVDGLTHRIATRWVRVVLVFVVFLGTWIAVGYFLEPHLREQVVTTAQNYDTWIQDADDELKKYAEERGFGDRLEDFQLSEFIESALGLVTDTKEGETATDKTIAFMKGVAGWILAIGSAFFLSLLFSFLIVLDLPKLTRQVQGLAHTRIGFIYNEVADNIYGFCRVLGRAMEAQAFIAICNTVLTALGLWVIGLGEGNMVFLCTIVFLCSFIPVAGVFISSTPICIVALSEHGFGMMIVAIAMILIIHFVEAYFLNPKIYGTRLRMNPVLTLIILTVCGKLFGPWGLILGIPILSYFFSDAIRYKQPKKITGAQDGDRERPAASA